MLVSVYAEGSTATIPTSFMVVWTGVSVSSRL